MDWKSRRVEATLEQALVEDRVTNDVTTAMTIEPGLRASGTVFARQDCVISGLGCIPRFLEIFIRLDKRTSSRFEVINHPEMFDGDGRGDVVRSPVFNQGLFQGGLNPPALPIHWPSLANQPRLAFSQMV